MFFQRSERERQRDYLHFGRQVLYYYDNSDDDARPRQSKNRSVGKSGFGAAFAHIREDMRSGILPMLIIAVAFDAAFLMGTTTGILTAGGHLNGIIAAATLVNTLAAAGMQRYRQVDQTLRDLKETTSIGGDALLRRKLSKLEREVAPVPRGPIGQLIDRLANKIGPGAPRPSLIPARITARVDSKSPDQRTYRDEVFAIRNQNDGTPISGGSPESPEPQGHPRLLQQFFRIAHRLHENTEKMQQRFGYSAEQALPHAERFTRAELAVQPQVFIRSLLSKLTQRGPATEFGLLALAGELYRDTLSHPGSPGFAAMLEYFENKSRAQLS